MLLTVSLNVTQNERDNIFNLISIFISYWLWTWDKYYFIVFYNLIIANGWSNSNPKPNRYEDQTITKISLDPKTSQKCWNNDTMILNMASVEIILG